MRLIFGWILKRSFLSNSVTKLIQKQVVEDLSPSTHGKYYILSVNITEKLHMFPKNEKVRFSISDIFPTLLQPCFFQWSKALCVNFHRPTNQEFTPTSYITLLILCSRQAIVSLCRPGGVRAARFSKCEQNENVKIP